MTVIRPNSISGVSSITGQGGDISIFRADGTAADLIVNNVTTGVITATSFSGSGANLTNIPAGNLTGTVADARLTTVSSSKLSGALPALDGSALTGVGIGTDGSVNTSGIVTATSFVSNTPFSNRNRVINGGMLINQRSSSYTATGEEYLLDRFNHRTGSGFTFDTTTTQSTSAPDGFTKSLKITPDSTQTPSGSHNGMIGHLIEADNLLGFASGTSSAKSFALSFYAKSASQNNNHQYSVQLSKKNSGGTYYYQNRSFVVTSSWQRFTVVFPADTSNNITTGNGEGLRILWHLSAGPDDIASAVTSWTSSNGNHAVTGQSNFMDNTSNEFYLTGVQLEVGPVATPFEHRSVGDELHRCQRYYYQFEIFPNQVVNFLSAYGSTYGKVQYSFPVTMRANPTGGLSDIGGVQEYLNGTWNNRTLTIAGTRKDFVQIFNQRSDSGFGGQYVRASSGTPICTLNAEL